MILNDRLLFCGALIVSPKFLKYRSSNPVVFDIRLVLPNDINKASRCKLPGIDCIDIKRIIILMIDRNIVPMNRGQQSSIILQIIKFIDVYLAPVMTCPESELHLIIETILRRYNILHSITVTL